MNKPKKHNWKQETEYGKGHQDGGNEMCDEYEAWHIHVTKDMKGFIQELAKLTSVNECDGWDLSILLEEIEKKYSVIDKLADVDEIGFVFYKALNRKASEVKCREWWKDIHYHSSTKDECKAQAEAISQYIKGAK